MAAPAFYSTGSWQPLDGQEEQFVEAWREFTGWATTLPGAVGDAVLVRDLRDPTRFISFLPWEDIEAIKAWKAHAEFMRRIGQVQQHVDQFAPTETEVVARVTGGS